MGCVLHECLGNSKTIVAPLSLPPLQPFILAIEAAEIRLLKKGTPAFMLREFRRHFKT
jgi:hypothetical protein